NRVTSRRQVVLALGAGMLAAPLGAVAQPQGRVYRVGYLSGGSRPNQSNPNELEDAVFRTLRELGYVEGRNLLVERRYSERKYEALPELAAELVKLNPDVIVAMTTPPSIAAQKATSTVPVVAVFVSDPVASGLAKSLGHPGGNITGLSDLTTDLFPKLLELLKVIKPALSRVAFLDNPANPIHLFYLEALPQAAKQLGVTVDVFDAKSVQDIERAFPLMQGARSEGLVVGTDALLYFQSPLVARLAIESKLPAVFAYRQEALAGGLMSYGPNPIDICRRAAGVVDKILKGAKPGDLPFEQPTLFDLVVNLKTANALGVKVPQSLLLRADKLIE
ncbi:MAG: ABC transporter substrate-binding protein, partial [Burkholderiales bacterium]